MYNYTLRRQLQIEKAVKKIKKDLEKITARSDENGYFHDIDIFMSIEIAAFKIKTILRDHNQQMMMKNENNGGENE